MQIKDLASFPQAIFELGGQIRAKNSPQEGAEQVIRVLNTYWPRKRQPQPSTVGSMPGMSPAFPAIRP